MTDASRSFVIRRSSFVISLRQFPRLLLAIVSIFVAGHFVRAEEWVRRDGQSFEARFVRLRGTAVVFSRDGLEFAVPIYALSPTSLEMARRQAVRATVAIPATRAARAVPVNPLPVVASFSCNPSILSFCRDNLGRKIGTGQCAALAVEALKNSGAASRGTDWPAAGDYVWGDPVALVKASFGGPKGTKDLARVEAGDIVQFHNTRFSGYNHGDNGVYRMEAKHHTAVVESVDPSHNTITVLYQNWNGRMVVRRQTLKLGGMTRGWLRFYHPVPTAG